MLGVSGWTEFKAQSNFWKIRPKLYKYCIGFALTLNLIALILISPAATKKSRVDTMSYLRGMNDVKGLFIERSEEYGCYLLPKYYLDDWYIKHVCFSKEVFSQLDDIHIEQLIEEQNSNYILFVEKRNIEARIDRFKNIYPGLEYVETIDPSYLDKLLHFLNPVNKNESIFIYRIPNSTL